jgi:cell division protein FtsQ
LNAVNVKRRTPEEIMRRKRRNRVLVLAFFIFVGLVIALESPLTRIRTISVAGNRSVPSNRIVGESHLKKGMSLWQINQGAVQSAIRSREPVVDKVTVQTDYLHGQVTLHVSQKNVVAIFVQNGRFYNLLSDGTVYNEINGNSGFQEPIISAVQTEQVSVGKRIPNSSIAKLCEKIADVARKYFVSVSEISVDKLDTATLYLNNGFEVRLSIPDFSQTMPKVDTAVSYFVQQGYKPGMLDMSGQPPYIYSPLTASSGKGKSQ